MTKCRALATARRRMVAAADLERVVLKSRGRRMRVLREVRKGFVEGEEDGDGEVEEGSVVGRVMGILAGGGLSCWGG
jgi:hypothetical protein